MCHFSEWLNGAEESPSACFSCVMLVQHISLRGGRDLFFSKRAGSNFWHPRQKACGRERDWGSPERNLKLESYSQPFCRSDGKMEIFLGTQKHLCALGHQMLLTPKSQNFLKRLEERALPAQTEDGGGNFIYLIQHIRNLSNLWHILIKYLIF